MAQLPGYALQRLGEVTNLPTLPSTLHEILLNLEDPNVNFATLKQIVYRDPPLAARLLRIANSAFYGRKEPTSSLETAFLILGLNEVIAIISSVGVVNAFAHAGDRSFDRRVLWRHSVMTGLVARYLSRKLGLHSETGGDEFVAGLLHDLGHIVISLYFPDEFGRIISKQDSGINPIEIERDELGNDHAEISAFIAARWRFADPLIDVLRHHHDPEKVIGQPILVRLIQLTDRLASWRAGDEPPLTADEFLEDFTIWQTLFPGIDEATWKRHRSALSNFKEDFIKLEELSEKMI